MTYLKKIIFAASLAAALLGMSVNANAVLITQDIIFDDFVDSPDAGPIVVGQFTVSVLENGASSIGPDFVEEFVSFTYMGEEVDPGGYFEANFDGDDLYSGMLDLVFELDITSLDVTIDGFYTTLFAGFNELTESDINDFNNVIKQGLLSLSAARVVSEPSVLALFALALIGFGVRRKAK